MRYYFIANTLHRRYEKSLMACAGYLHDLGHTVEVTFTLYPGHARELACAAVESGWDVIVGAGGDGTLHEVLNGMIGSKALLGLFPMGTGNVFAREMRLPAHWRSIAKMLHEAHTLWLDTGRIGERYFLLMLSAGFDAYAIRMLSSMEGRNRNVALRQVFGRFAYVFGALQAFGRYTFPRIEVEADGVCYEGSFVLVSNIQRYGRYFKMTPHASPLDGQLDVFLYREMGAWNLLRLAWQVLSSFWRPYGGGVLFHRVHVLRCTSLTMKSEGEVFSQADGELFQKLPLSIAVCPRSVQMILPRGIFRKYQSIASSLQGSSDDRNA